MEDSTESVVLEQPGDDRPTGAPPPQSPAQAKQHRFDFHGTLKEFATVFLKNMLLTILTLGIYRAWAKTNVRKFLWSSTEFHGQRFEFLGTGRELMNGYAKIGIVFVLYTFISRALYFVAPAIAPFVEIGVGLLIGTVLVPFAIFSAYRYRLSRTAWRGVTFGVDPVAKEYIKQFLIGSILSFVTLGLYGPIMQNRLYATTINNSRFGNAYFAYDGVGSEAFRIWIKGIALSILTLGIYLPWFWAEVGKYRWSHTYFGESQGRYHIKGGELAKLMFTNLLIVILTLGLGAPFLIVRNAKFLVSRVEFEGNIDFNEILIRNSQGNATGDGLADVMDVGLEL